jgi:GAF domain-containing protein
VIRRLGLEKPDELHKSTLDRFTRLAVSIFKTKRALVSVIGRERQVFLSEIGMGAKSTSFEDAFCCHTIIGNGESCMVVPDAANDWRFAKNPLVDEGKGIVQFYAGAPLRVGQGPKAAIIGSMCIIDDVPRHDFDEEGKRLLADLAECAVSAARIAVQSTGDRRSSQITSK